MSSIITGILKATVGLLVNKGREYAAEKLKDGDVTDQQFRKLVVRELDDIKSKIDGLAGKDLKASVSFFKEGLVFLYQLLDHLELRVVNTATARAEAEEEKPAASLPSASGGSKLSVNTSSLVEGLKVLKLKELNETAKPLLKDAKKRFKDARRRATDAFSNEGLQLTDRILAIKIRIMATLMEKVDSPSSALASCGLCLEELHSIPAVQSSFEVEVTRPVKYRFNKKERREVIAEVCHVNFVVYSVTRMVHWRDVKLPVIGNLEIDPLRDGGLTKALSKFGLDWCCVRDWTFGQEDEVNYRLDGPRSITTNTQGQFIVADLVNLKVFDRSGKFLRFLNPLTEDERKQLTFVSCGVTTDGNDNLYVLALIKNSGTVQCREVYVFDQHYNLHHKFLLGEKVNYTLSLTVSNDGKVLVPVTSDGAPHVDVYETDGRFLYRFELGISSSPLVRDITTATNGMIMVLDGSTDCVHVFSTQGDHLHQFAVQGNTERGAIAFHQPSEHVTVSSLNPDNENRGQLSIYTKDGEFVRSIQLHTDKMPWLYRLTVTLDGFVAVTNYKENKVHIISF